MKMLTKLKTRVGVILTLMTVLSVTACNNEMRTSDMPSETTNEIKIDYRTQISQITKKLYRQDPLCGLDNVDQKVFDLMGIKATSLRSTHTEKSQNYVASQTATTTLNQMMSIDPSEYDLKEDYTKALLSIVRNNTNLTQEESIALEIASYVSADIIELKYGETDTELRAKWWDDTKKWCKKQWDDWGRCAAGVVGSAGGGALGGAAAGSAVPAIGTVAGGVVGGVSGALVGAATFC